LSLSSDTIEAIQEIRYQHDPYDIADGITLQFDAGSIRILNLADDIVLEPDHHLDPAETRSPGPRHT
jgi:hypothetical protein